MKKNLTAILVLLIVVQGCKLPGEPADEYTTIELTEKTSRLIEAENQFGFELFRHVFSGEKEHENVMVSPLSVSLALAMTYNGAEGETKRAMENTLKVHGLTPEEINKSYFDLINSLKSLDRKVLLEIANAIFYRHDFEVENEFITLNRNYYDASVSALDFDNEQQSLKTINGWVNEKTHGKIESIIDQINSDHVMFLLNAIYFKGIWQTEFDKKNTTKLPFHTESNEIIEAETMQLTDTVQYASNNLFSAVQLPYGRGNYNMHILLPNTGNTLHDIVDQLNHDNWEAWMKDYQQSRKVDIKLPRFRYEYETVLNDVLTTMGMGVAFTGAADFSGINRQGNLQIDYVKHKSFIEVNEEGTEAAAVTVVAIELTSVGGQQNIQFIVNRPFMYVVTERSTGAVLFMGTVKNPALN